MSTLDAFASHVPIKSAWLSKINWVQALAILAQCLNLISGGVVNVTPNEQVAIGTTIGVIHAIATWFLRTYHNNSITPADALTNELALRQQSRGT